MTEDRTRSAGSAPTAAQLKEAIDGGDAGDKVDFPDPAASPLGTDAEAGGAGPSPKELSTAYRSEISGNPKKRATNRTLLAIAGFIAVIAIAAVLSLLVIPGT